MDFILAKLPDTGLMLPNNLFDICRGAIATADPDDLGWKSENEASLMKVGILRHNDKAVITGKLPDDGVICVPQTHEPHMRRTGVDGLQGSHQARRQVLIQEKLHEGIVTSLRSRSAAKARRP